MIVDQNKVRVNQFVGTGYGVNTPHLVGNEADEPCRNVTVKYGEAILDRWDLKEAPDESEFTFISNVLYPEVEQKGGTTIYSFEKEFTKYCGREYGISTSNGTSALHIAFKLAGVRFKCNHLLTKLRNFLSV